MKRGAFAAALLVLAVLLTALGAWQLERRAWKLALIDRVEQRLKAPPAPPPSWSAFGPDAAYTRVRLHGRFRHDRETLVQAVTELGPGWWVVTPLKTPTGVVLVNRGYVPAERKDPATRSAGAPAGEVDVVGLLRRSEPGGGFLRANVPAAGRWYSRDVAAIAQARGLGATAPYFVDADAAPNAGGYPVGGLTVVAFRNPHLVYALTWFALAAMALAGVALLYRDRIGRPRRPAG